LLVDNIDRIGFVSPILVVPFDDDGTTLYRIVDGEHRWEAARVERKEKISCVVVDPALFDEKTMKVQTVRMNKIRGSLDIRKFNNLVKDLIENHEIPFDEMANELGFADEDEFALLVDETRKSLPAAARKEFDKKVKQIRNYDDLIRLVEQLYEKYGNTLPTRFMVLDFGREESLMVQIDGSQFSLFQSKFLECQDNGYTVDSVLTEIMKGIDITQFIEDNKTRLVKAGVPIDETTIETEARSNITD